MPTTNGSPIYRDHVPAADAWVVERLRNLGATIFGKTVSTEFAWRHPGPTVNPWNSGHTPGGSSSGSAAAVAAGIVPLALGTQTLGSVIRPDLMEMLAQMGMTRERVEQIRQMVQQNMQGMQEQMDQFAGQRIAENMSERPRSENVDALMNCPFNALSDADKQLLQREVKKLAAALRTRIALRQKRARTGQLDAKATIRASLKYHGVPMEINIEPRSQAEDRGDL